MTSHRRSRTTIDDSSVASAHHTVQLAVLTVLALAFRSAEVFIPTPLPWLRIGLANAVVLLAIAQFGFRDALLVNVARIFLPSIIFGGLLGPGFWLSLCAGVVSTSIMALLYSRARPWLSLVAISAVGAYAHTMTQFFVAYWLYVRHECILGLMPYFLLVALGTGSVTGVAAAALLFVVRRYSVRPGQPALGSVVGPVPRATGRGRGVRAAG